MIRITLTVVAAETIAVGASVLAWRLLLPGLGIGPAHGYPALSLANGPVLGAAAGSIPHPALIALGIAAAAVRDSATRLWPLSSATPA
jgi:ABC-2 type transport system permease protein